MKSARNFLIGCNGKVLWSGTLSSVNDIFAIFFFETSSVREGSWETPSAGSKEGEPPASIKALLSGTASVITFSYSVPPVQQLQSSHSPSQFLETGGLGFKVQGLGFRGLVNTRNGPAYDCLSHVYLVMLQHFF